MGRGINNLREEFRMSGATKDSFRCVESSSFGRRHHRFRSFVIIASSAAAFNLNLLILLLRHRRRNEVCFWPRFELSRFSIIGGGGVDAPFAVLIKPQLTERRTAAIITSRRM